VDSLEGFEEFVEIVEAGSVSAAARAVGLPRATLSRRLQRLEDALKVRLIHRNTRSMSLTDAGRTLYARARTLVSEARAVRDEIAQLDDHPRGLLRISTPPGIGGEDAMGPMFRTFLEKHPEVELDVVATSRFVDLAAEGYDIAFRAGALEEDGYVSRLLRRVNAYVYAAPSLVEQFGEPKTPADLEPWPKVLGLDGHDHPIRAWSLRDGRSMRVSGRVVSNDMGFRLSLAVAGLGLAQLPEAMGLPAERAGRLVRILPELLGGTGAIRLVYVERAFMPLRIRAFIDHVVAYLEANPGPIAPRR